MARKKSVATIDTEISKIKSEMAKLQDRYDALADQLKKLQEQRRKIVSETVMDAFDKSGKSLDELMTFLQP